MIATALLLPILLPVTLSSLAAPPLAAGPPLLAVLALAGFVGFV